MTAEVLEAVNQMLRAHREEMMELVNQSSNELATRMEAELRSMGNRVTRAEEQIAANDKM